MNVYLISSWSSHPYIELLTRGLVNSGINTEQKKWKLFFLFDFLKQYDATESSIIHFHTIHDSVVSRFRAYSWVKLFLFVSQLFLLRLFGFKILWTVHEWADKICNGKHEISNLKASVIGFFFDAIVVHCESTREEIISAFSSVDENRVKVIPHGNFVGYYNNHISQDLARKKLKICSGQVVFLIFGSIHPSKGVLEAIHSFKELEAKNVKLLIAGKAGNNELLTTIKKAASEDSRISFFNQNIEDDQVQVYMNASNCVILPYKIFTTSGVALLAMSFARPCIVPEIGFFKDTFDPEGAIFYDPLNKRGLSKALQEAVNSHQDLLAKGKHNIEKVAQWDWENIAAQTTDLYYLIG